MTQPPRPPTVRDALLQLRDHALARGATSLANIYGASIDRIEQADDKKPPKTKKSGEPA